MMCIIKQIAFVGRHNYAMEMFCNIVWSDKAAPNTVALVSLSVFRTCMKGHKNSNCSFDLTTNFSVVVILSQVVEPVV